MAQTIGQQLRQIRESQGLTLDELSQRTHIKIPYLKALEEGDVEALPSQTHLRGFLRLYAATLGVDLDELIRVSNIVAAEEELATQPEQQETVAELPEQEEEEEESPPDVPPATPRFAGVKQRFTGLVNKLPRIKLPKLKKKEIEPLPETVEVEPADGRTSEEIFTAIGIQLERRRNLISLSLEDVESQTHIRTQFLADMENGRFDRLPSPVQARGMLANYAGFLSMNADSILLEYADGLQKKRLETIKTTPQKQGAKEISPTRLRLKNFFSLDLLVIALIFFVFAGFVIWGVSSILSADSPVASPTDLPEVSDVLLATGTVTPDLIETLEESQTAEVTEGAAGDETTPIPTSIPNNSAIAIVIIPIQNAWVRVTSDGELVYEGRVLTGNAYDYYADETLELLTGSAGALQVFFDDQDIGSIGLIGQVSTLVFTPNGLVMPTPTVTPTPTLTPEESSTPSLTPSPTPTEPEANDTGS
ncbi:MAG: DUF4115 domain-containing protein [Anaerolineaceae bacterium]|jgi:cytoskeletal protein RodZ|nr:DUF4115 domain-containing protein [Anaerolineaceae bacterium]